MRVRVETGPGAVEALRGAGWDDLLARAGPLDPLRRAAVLALPDPAGERAAVPRAIWVEHEGRTVAAAALGVGRERGLTTVRHLGHAPNWFEPDPPAEDDGARATLVDALLQQPGDVLLLEELAGGGPLARAIVRRRPDVEILAGPSTYRVTTGRWRPHIGRRRREARRLRRRAAERGLPATVSVWSGWGSILPQVDELIALLERSWAGRRPDAFAGTDAGRRHVRRTLEALGAEDRLRLIRLDLGGQLAAFHLAAVWGTAAVIYKTAFDRALQGLPGPGWYSLLATIDRLGAEGVRRIDLGPGGGEYKGHLAEPEPTVALRIALSPVGRVYLLAAGAKHAAGRRLRPGGRVV